MRNRWLVVCALLIHLTCAAQQPTAKPFAGTWVMRLGDRTLFVLTLTSKNTTVSDCPGEFSFEGNTVFSNIHGEPQHDPIVDSYLSDGSLHFTVHSSSSSKDVAQYSMSLRDNRAILFKTTSDDPAPNNPLVFERGTTGAKVSMDWEPNRAYSANDFDTPNPEMKAIYDEDQRVRSTEPINWDLLNKSDPPRREQTRRLLSIGALHTGRDYEEAAFIFQHGQTTDDFLLAHTLALVAVSKGDAGAIWIATATFDRYLQRVGQKQIYGTQYTNDGTHPWTQEPFNHDLVSDALREQLGAQSETIDKSRLNYLNTQHKVPGAK